MLRQRKYNRHKFDDAWKVKKIQITAGFNGSHDNLIDFSGKYYGSYPYIFIGGHVEGNYSLNIAIMQN